MEKIFSGLKNIIISLLVFLFPLFFLTLTPEFFITNKIYLFAFGVLALLLISTISFVFSKKMSWRGSPFDAPIILFLLTVGLSVIISSPNKIQALLNPSFGFLSILILIVFYFYVSRASVDLSKVFSISTVFLSITTIVFFFQPFKNTNLPIYFQFLKNPNFTPLGNQIDLIIYLGFVTLYQLFSLLSSSKQTVGLFKKHALDFAGLILSVLALFLTGYLLIKQVSSSQLTLPPFSISWYGAVETLKHPLTAVFGVGVDNFASMFTLVKNVAYNQSNLWQINSFDLSHSTFLHIMTETGILGIAAFIFMLAQVFKQILSKDTNRYQLILFVYLFICLLALPPSFPLFFLLFLIIANLAKSTLSQNKLTTLDLAEVVFVSIGLAIVSLFSIGVAGYFIGRAYLSDFYFKKSLDGFVNKDVKTTYENQRQAIILNPYNEKLRTSFSQINLLIADNVATKANETQTNKLTEEERQTVTNAIQAAISEAKAVVTLNPQKAGNWEKLALIYRNVISVAQGADSWSISSYQRAILLDPINPLYRLNLGGIYYLLGQYPDAISLFQQAIELKPNWSNSYYNLAWSYYQNKEYDKAANMMQATLQLIDKKTNLDDWNKANNDLTTFKSKLESVQNSQESKSDLNLPKQPAATISPKINLPKEASPEAK